MKDLTFFFSLNKDGHILYVNPHDIMYIEAEKWKVDKGSVKCTEEEGRRIINRIVEKKMINLGERTDGFVSILSNDVFIEYSLFTKIGEEDEDEEWIGDWFPFPKLEFDPE